MYKTMEAYLEAGQHSNAMDACDFDGLGLLHVCAYSLASVDRDTADHLVLVAQENKMNLNLPCNRERSPTALMIACGVGNASFALALVKYCPTSHGVCDDQGNTSIFYAVGSIINTKRIMEALVSAGADLNVSSDLSRAAIHEGAMFYYTDPANLQALIDLGANMEQTDSIGLTALHYACLPGLEGNFSSARVLLKNGAHVNAKDNWGRTPLHFCTMDMYRSQHRREMVRLPIERFHTSWVPPRDEGVVQFELLNLLLQNGADPAASDDQGNLPFFYICNSDNISASQLSSIFSLVQATSYCGLFR